MNVALIAFVLGLLAAISALLLLVPVRASALRPGGASKLLAGVGIAVPLVAVVMLSADRPGSGNDTAPLPAMAAMNAGAGADEWSQAARILGGGTTAVGPATGVNPHSAEELASFAAQDPRNVQAWLALGRAQRQARDYAAAAVSYEKALGLDERNPDVWADYADALASAGDRSLEGGPAEAISRALQLDPRHPKALWLQASLDLQRRQYAQALKNWQLLRSALPPGSPDIAIVEANITEARQLLAQGGTGG